MQFILLETFFYPYRKTANCVRDTWEMDKQAPQGLKKNRRRKETCFAKSFSSFFASLRVVGTLVCVCCKSLNHFTNLVSTQGKPGEKSTSERERERERGYQPSKKEKMRKRERKDRKKNGPVRSNGKDSFSSGSSFLSPQIGGKVSDFAFLLPFTLIWVYSKN